MLLSEAPSSECAAPLIVSQEDAIFLESGDLVNRAGTVGEVEIVEYPLPEGFL